MSLCTHVDAYFNLTRICIILSAIHHGFIGKIFDFFLYNFLGIVPINAIKLSLSELLDDHGGQCSFESFVYKYNFFHLKSTYYFRSIFGIVVIFTGPIL